MVNKSLDAANAIMAGNSVKVIASVSISMVVEWFIRQRL
jgi:mannose/fructose-specific phosphotransferase system component IIA